MAIQCPGCRAPLEVEQSDGWPYIRSAVLMHLDVCRVLRCNSEQRLRCADALADSIVSGEAFHCPFDQCRTPN